MKQEISTGRLVEAPTLIRYSESVVGERHNCPGSEAYVNGLHVLNGTLFVRR